MNLHKKLIIPSSPTTPLTPHCRLRERTPHTPHTPLTPLTPISTNCIAAAPGSLTSISINHQQQLEDGIMNWFNNKGICQGDLIEFKASILGYSR